MRNFLVFLFLSFLLTSIGQSPIFHVDGLVKNSSTAKQESGVKVLIVQNGATLHEFVTPQNGKYDIRLEVNYAKPFELIFRKEGFYSKKIAFDYSKLNPEDELPAGDFEPWKGATTDIFPKSIAADLSFLESEPIAKFGNGANPVPVKSYNDKMKEKVEKSLKDGEAAKKDRDIKYQEAISEADALYAQKKYEAALSKYELAIKYKEKEKYPNDRILELDALIQAMRKTELVDQQANAGYRNILAAADALRDQKKYDLAIEKYEEALDVKDEQYPKDQISAIKKAKKEAENQLKFDQTVTAADMFFNQKSYLAAKEKYLAAKKLKQDDTHVATRLAEIDKKLNEQAATKSKQMKLDSLLALGQDLFDKENWLAAKAKYTEASLVDASASEPAAKIKECDNKILAQAKEKEKQDKIAKLLSDGDQFATANKFVEAKAKFNEVLVIDATNELAKSKLAGIKQKEEDAKQAALEAAKSAKDAATLKEEKEYNAILSLAKSKEELNELDAALGAYKQARDKRPSDQFPKDKIIELQEKKEKQAQNIEKDKNYSLALKRAETFMAQQKYLDAIGEYNVAHALKPEELLPVTKAKEAEELEKNKGSEEKQNYEKIFSVASKAIDEGDFKKAVDLIERAKNLNNQLKIVPNDPRPQQLLSRIAALELEEKKYAQKMVEAEKFASAKEFTKAIQSFEEAARIKTSATKPQERILELEKIVAQNGKIQQQQATYSSYIATAKKLESDKKYEEALVNYNLALESKNNDRFALDKVSEINQILANKELLAKKEQDLMVKFNDLVFLGDEQVKINNAKEAKKWYTKALELIPTSEVVKAKLEACNKLISAPTISNSVNEYKKLIQSADELFAAKKYSEAKNKYQQALGLQPTESYPTQKIAEIEVLTAPALAQATALPSLGEPFDNSIMDGYAALVKADLERKNSKNSAIHQQSKVLSNKSETESLELQKEKQQDSKGISKVQKELDKKTSKQDGNRILTAQDLHRSNQELDKGMEKDNRFKKSEILQAQGKINSVAKESEVDAALKRANQVRNEEEIERLKATNQGRNNQQQSEDLVLRRAEESRIDATNRFVQNEEMATYGKQFVSGDLVAKIVKEQENNLVTNAQIKSQDLLLAANNMEKVRINVDLKTAVDNAVPMQNSEQIENSQLVVNLAEKEKNSDKIQAIHSVEKELASVHLEDYHRQNTYQTNRLATVDNMRLEQNKEEESAYAKYASETEKHLKEKGFINRENTIISAQIEKDKVKVDAKNQAIYTQSTKIASEQISDEAERLTQSANIAKQVAENEKKAQLFKENGESNTKKVGDVSKNLQDGNDGNFLQQHTKSQSAQLKLDKVETSKPKKVKLANSLGQEYPEGVSQESFTQSDENGLMKSIITRRIVVQNGHGTVYVRTQTLHAITYTKNDQPTTEYIWQIETTGPGLQKHY